MFDDEPDREADRLLSAAIYLMSCHASNGCPRLASMVGQHLKLVARHPRAGELVRETCHRLAAAWEALRLRDERRTGQTGAACPLEALRFIVA